MKKPHINVIHYMSKTASLGYEGKWQTMIVEFFISAISVTLTVYGFVTDWDLLIPIFIMPAILGSLGFCTSVYLAIDDYFHTKKIAKENEGD